MKKKNILCSFFSCQQYTALKYIIYRTLLGIIVKYVQIYS
uniref:Uncharacterized protein n=1 Tax=Anguilla anguilla TaxID=7936 RepID=A0A0E9P970_ANGAN